MVNSERNQMETLDAQRINNCLIDVRRRMYRQALLQAMVTTFFCGLVLLAALFCFNRVILLPLQMSVISSIIVFVAIAVGIYLSLKHRKDLLFVARSVDQKMELKERLGTAYALMHTTPRNEFAQRQIQDAVETVATLDLAEISPYRIPKFLKLFPLPLLLIAVSFTIPTFYEVPQPLTGPRQQALDRVIQNLEGEQVKNSDLQKQISDTVKRLKVAKDLDTAQRHLSNLKKAVRQQSEQTAVTEATEASQSFQGMDAKQLAAELENLAEQAEIPPELQAELMDLFARLAEDLPEGALNNSLNQIQGKAVTPETLQDIIAALEEVAKSTDLAQLEAQLTASQKELALATIETETTGGGIANSDGAPGRNTGTSEVQGTPENILNSDPLSELQTTEAGTDNEMNSEGTTSPLVGEATPILRVNGEQLTLTTAVSGDAQGFADVFTGAVRNEELDYLPFSEAVLNASRAYAEAIDNRRVPVRYRAQIKAYLEAISPKNEE